MLNLQLIMLNFGYKFGYLKYMYYLYIVKKKNMRQSDGRFCTKATFQRESAMRKSISYLNSVVIYQPAVIRQLTEEVLELRKEIKQLKIKLKNK